jgi:predicted transcriptional regulator
MWEILPENLLSRIYALNEAKLHEGVTHTLKMVDDAIKSSREYLLVVLSEVPFDLVPSVLGRLSENVPVKLALTQEAIDHVTQFFKENPQYNPDLLKRASIRVIDSCFACTAINEKVAGTNLINRQKPHEHFSSHFIGDSPSFREWCKDVYGLHEAKSKST